MSRARGNIFNYLFPGAVFSVLGGQLGIIDLPAGDIATALLIYYFVGLAISRLGSVVLEPLAKAVRFVSYSDYGAYLRACVTDPKIELMVEVSNTYRTLVMTFAAILLTALGNAAADRLHLEIEWRNVIMMVALMTLFAFSFRKQAAYVAKRVAHATSGAV